MDNSENFYLGFSILSQIEGIPISNWLYIFSLILGMLILLLASAFISASEIAFFSLSKIDLKSISESEKSKGKQLQLLLEEPDRLLATILIVNNTVNIGMILLSTLVVDELQNQTETPEWILFLLQIVGITALLLLFGEIIPKVYATQKNKTLAIMMVKTVSILGKFVYIPAKSLVKLSKRFDKKLKWGGTSVKR